MIDLNRFSYFIRFYKKSIIWLLFGIVSITLIFPIQVFLTNYDSQDVGSRIIILGFLVAIFAFTIIFFLFSFIKFYDGGKQGLKKLLDSNHFNMSDWTLFTIVAIAINVDIILLLKTEAFDYILTLVPQLKTFLEGYFGTLESNEMNDIVTESFNEILLFKIALSSFGSLVIVFLKNLRQTEIRKQSDKYPGIRILLLFFFFSFIGILSSVVSDTNNSIAITSIVTFISNLIILSLIASLAIYLIDSILFSKIKSLL